MQRTEASRAKVSAHVAQIEGNSVKVPTQKIAPKPLTPTRRVGSAGRRRVVFPTKTRIPLLKTKARQPFEADRLLSSLHDLASKHRELGAAVADREDEGNEGGDHANLNLRYQFKKALDHEREKYHRLEDENRQLAIRVKDLESQKAATKRSPSSASNLHRSNELALLRKKLKDAEAANRRLAEQVTLTQRQLEKEAEAKAKVDKEHDNLRHQFTHMRGMDLAGVTSGVASEDEGALTTKKGFKPGAIAGEGVRQKKPPAFRLSKPMVERSSVDDANVNDAVEPRRALPPRISRNLGGKRPEHPDSQRIDQALDEKPRSLTDQPTTTDGPPAEDQSNQPKSKLPKVFRKGGERQRSVLANLDRDLREAGSLIDSMDQDLLRAADTRKRQRWPTGGSSNIAGSDTEDDGKLPPRREERKRPARPVVDVGEDLLGEKPGDGKEPALPRMEEEDGAREGIGGGGDARMRDAKIRVEYDIWVKHKKGEKKGMMQEETGE
ncbi:hypothetical protein HKX48_002683 [Thoreauomyces humboldtii]|nr:hypothetical protein HKX48_002683 [Thoreauomyces humboldtii]